MNADTLSALAAYITDQAVSSARAVSIAGGLDGSAHAEMAAGDGSRWWIVAAPYGAGYGWADDHDAAVAACAADISARRQRLAAANAGGWAGPWPEDENEDTGAEA